MANIIKFPGNTNKYAELNTRIQKLKTHIDNLINELKSAKTTLTEIELQLSKLRIHNKFQLLKFNKDKDNQ